MNRRAFTIIELLVAVSIIGILIAILIPTMGAMGSQTRESAAVNTIGVAVGMARTYAAKPRPAVNLPPSSSQGFHRGAAALFTPSGEIRLVETDPLARDTTSGSAPTYGYLQLKDYDPGASGFEPDYAVGFKDITSAEFIRMPNRIRVQGIGRNSDTTLLLLDPPFAIRFDEYGHQLVSTATSTNSVDRQVIYDGNHNGLYDVSSIRGSYSYQTYVDNLTTHWDSSLKKHRLPFERIESVVGVRVFNPDKPSEIRDIYFSRYTGAPRRTR